MKRPAKIALGVVAAVVVLVIAGVAVLLGRLDGIVESTVEKEGTNQLSLATALDGADVSIFGGSLALDGLTIANPEGYVAPNLFEMGQVSVGVGWSGLTNDPLTIDAIDINSPLLVIERGGDGGGLAEQLRLNLRDLLDRIETDPDSETTKMLIGRLTVANARVVVRPNLEELDEEYSLTIPDVTLNDIGTGEGNQNGAEIGRVVADVSMALAKEAAASEDLPPEVRAVLSGDLSGLLSKYGNELSDRVREELNEELDGLGDRIGGEAGNAINDVLKGAGGEGENVRDNVENRAREGVQRGIGNLLGGGSNNDDGE